MSNKDIVAVFPSRANEVIYKQKVLSAQRGHNFLKRKRDALEFKLNEINRERNKKRNDMNKIMHEAIILVAKAKFIGLDIKPIVVQSIPQAELTIKVTYYNVAGVILPTLLLNINDIQPFPLTGLGRGGQHVTNIRKYFLAATEYLVDIGSLEYSASVLEAAIHQTKLRVNGLEFVLIPKFHRTLAYIRDELDEFSREEFYRLKRSQNKKKKKKADRVDEIRNEERRLSEVKYQIRKADRIRRATSRSSEA